MFDWNLAISADNDCCENGKIKVLDFGLSTLAKSKHQDGLLHITDGTSAYVAPEVNRRKGYEDSKADVWSCEQAIIAHHKNGSIYVIDLGSAHGTFVANE
ncbi:hypothetical protein F0562_015310 [Nyssa sinensis]|uniref:Protein kinase domain-containing protein n=1 Tax=Nyssa sinensis TaxID=561372 RepID=A0A5J4ZGX2_9ASTE|nr:hypothetical protein F0562_015310 [Nyssa sinensis]